MNDTTPEMAELQKRLIMSLSEGERFKMGLQMAEDGWNLMLSGIRSRHPETAGDERAFRRAVLAHLQRFDPAGYGWIRPEDV
ncbi:hypothetical protein [Fibrella aquatilis]|uniref:Uncharacterized protein n=1 Tax=Fibrella aquatilis TaxID=2817059 RepID=A0A939GCN0_9BACT|nr:hypothetical protein [Fibrella aquatilis]MBO0933948.1 hypothetical protein [Fibrella aquatilis]